MFDPAARSPLDVRMSTWLEPTHISSTQPPPAKATLSIMLLGMALKRSQPLCRSPAPLACKLPSCSTGKGSRQHRSSIHQTTTKGCTAATRVLGTASPHPPGTKTRFGRPLHDSTKPFGRRNTSLDVAYTRLPTSRVRVGQAFLFQKCRRRQTRQWQDSDPMVGETTASCPSKVQLSSSLIKFGHGQRSVDPTHRKHYRRVEVASSNLDCVVAVK